MLTPSCPPPLSARPVAAPSASSTIASVAVEVPLVTESSPEFDAPRVTPRPTRPLPLLQRIAVHNHVVRALRRFLEERGFLEIPVPELTPATGSCEIVDSMFSLDYFGTLAFPRQTGQLFLEELVAHGLNAVYCEGESLRKEWKVDDRHLTEFKLIEIEKRDMSLDELCDFQEELVKAVTLTLSAEEIGGANVTRLDRMLRREHPRLTYREAIGILRRRDFDLQFGDDLDHEAEAALIYHCGDLPVHITHFPETLKFFNMKIDRRDPTVVECVDYILPFAGETFGGSVRESDNAILRRRLEQGSMYRHLLARAREFARTQAVSAAGNGPAALPVGHAAVYEESIQTAFERYLSLFAEEPIERAGFGLGVARLLQYLLGLRSVKEAVAFPMDRARFGTLAPGDVVTG